MDERIRDERPTPETAREPADQEIGARAAGRRLEPVPRWTLSTVLLACAGGAVVYHALSAWGLTTTSALFVGLPTLLGLMVIHLPRTRSAYGRVSQAVLIFLAIVSPLLGEGAICILMAAPIFWGVAMVVTAIALVVRDRRVEAGLALLPLALGLAEQRTELLAPPTLVERTTHAVEGPAEAWRRAVRATAPVAENDSLFLALGFPLPTEYRREGGRASVRFSSAEDHAWQVAVEETGDGVVFRMLDDSTPIGDWIDVVESRVRVRATGEGRAEIVHATTFVPRLSPRAYFVPFERLALRRAHALAVRSWEQGLE